MDRRRELLERKVELERMLAEYKESNRIQFFQPFEHQQRTLDLINAGKKVVLLQGANQIGKTTLGAVVVGSACLGIQPWDMRPTVWGKRKVECRIICQDWEHHADGVIVPELKRWLPKGRYVVRKNNIGVEAYWEFPETGSTIELMTDSQPTELHEGWKGDLIWADEPCSREKFVAGTRGLMARSGVWLFTMTAVGETWILDSIVLNPDPSYGCVTEVPITANPTLDSESVRTFIAGLSEEEKITRVSGGWLNLIGLVWKEFRADVHVIDDFKIPTDWPVVAMIDYHTREPHAIGFYACDPNNVWYQCGEIWRNMSAEETADEIIRHKIAKDTCWRIEHAFIDPLSKGDSEYVKRMGITIDDSFTVIEKKLRTARIQLHVASKDKSSGIRNVQTWLKGPNGRPSLYFFRSFAANRYGHVWQIQRWTWDKDTGRPRDADDHFMENLYRLTLTGIRYKPMVNDSDIASNFIANRYEPLYFGIGV